MKIKDYNNILDVFIKGTELNIGIFPNTNVVKYGYCYINNELTLYLEVSGKEIDEIKNYVETNKTVHFNKWSPNGKFVSGDGSVTILEKEEEKTDGVNIIIKQQTGMKKNGNINANELTDIFIFKILVENVNMIQY